MNNSLMSSDPFFIFYDARSGSTFLSKLIVDNLNVIIPPESNFISMILKRYNRDIINDHEDLDTIIQIIKSDIKLSDWKLQLDSIVNEFSNMLPVQRVQIIKFILEKYVEKNSSISSSLGIKKDNYIDNYNDLSKIFPSTKFICLIRDGRAVFNSKKNSIYSMTKKPFETNPYRAARSWCNYIRKIDEIKSNYPNSTLFIRYEDLIQYPNKIIKIIQNHLQIDDNNTKNDFEYKVPKRYDSLHDNIVKSPIVNRINGWQEELNNKEIYSYESIAADLLLDNQYELIFSKNDLNNFTSKIQSFLSYIKK